MKKIAMIVGLCMLTLWIPLFAQDRSPKSAEERAKAMTERMKKELGLTDEQTAQVYTANLNRAQVVDEFKESSKEVRKEEREKFRNAQEKHRNEMQQILSPDQFTKWDQWQSENREKSKERIRERKGKAR